MVFRSLSKAVLSLKQYFMRFYAELSNVFDRGAPISKLTDIPITDISAMKTLIPMLIPI